MHTRRTSGRTLRGYGFTTALLATAGLLAAAPARAQQAPPGQPVPGQPPPGWQTPSGWQTQPGQPPPGWQTQPGQTPSGWQTQPGQTPSGWQTQPAWQGQPGQPPPPPGAPAKQDDGVREDPLKRYYFLGVRFRDIVVPQFLMEAFAKGGGTGNVWLIGPELSTRKDGMEIDISLAYADYGFGPAMFKGKEDLDIAYEVVRSDLKVGYLTFNLLLDVPLTESKMVSFLIGGGIGVGVVAGDLYRNQVYPKAGQTNVSDPSQWEYCNDVNDPDPVYCDPINDHYPSNGKKEYSEKSWIDGGQKPVVFPWISLPQISLRIKPIKQLQIRLDAGFSLSGFFFGLAAGYGL